MKGVHVAGLAFLVILAVTGCASYQTTESVQPAEHWSYTVRERVPAKGRTEYSGRLTYRNREIEPYFSEIVVGSLRFRFLIQTEREPFSGYRRVENAGGGAPETKSSSGPPAQNELRRGWYLGAADERKSGTPEEWIWVRRENLEAFVDPGRLGDLARDFKLGSIIRKPESNVQFKLTVEEHF